MRVADKVSRTALTEKDPRQENHRSSASRADEAAEYCRQNCIVGWKSGRIKWQRRRNVLWTKEQQMLTELYCWLEVRNNEMTAPKKQLMG